MGGLFDRFAASDIRFETAGAARQFLPGQVGQDPDFLKSRKVTTMDYQTCLKNCLKALGTDPADREDAQLYLNYPTPTDAEWADVLEVTATYDDVTNCFACMGQYETRLRGLGHRTVLGSITDGLVAAATEVGIPKEYIPDAILLLFKMRGYH